METKNVIQEDWSQREFVAKMHFGIQKIVSFLNRFEAEARFKLARVNEQLTRLERNCDFVEAILRHSDPSTRGAKPSSIQGTVFDSAWRIKEEKRRRMKRQEQIKPIVKKISSSVKGRILKAGMQSEMKEQRFQPSARITSEMKQPVAKPIGETKVEEKSEPRAEEKQSGEDSKVEPELQDKPMKIPPTPATPGDQVLPPPQPVATPLPPPPGVRGDSPLDPPAAPVSGPPVGVPPGAPSGPPQAGPPQVPPVGPPGVPQAALPPPIPQPGANMTGPPAQPPPGPTLPPPGPGASLSGPGAPPPGPGAPPGPGVPPVPFTGPPSRPPPQPTPGVPAETDVKISEDEDEEESSYEDPPIKEFRPPIPEDHNDIWIQRVSPGDNAKPGPLADSYLTIEYTGWIKNSGECFDQIDDFGLQMGSGDNIVGLEQILLKMKEGETILAYIPSHLAYGEEGGGDVIPPNSDLVFDLTLNSIK